MNRQQKEVVVQDFKKLLTESKATFLVGYRGLTVAQIQDLRRRLRDKDAILKITKARLMKIAAEGIEGIDSFAQQFENQVGLVFAKDEVPAVAKQLVEYFKKEGFLDIKSGFFESRVLEKQKVDFLASIPPRDILLAQVVGTVQAPLSGLARLLNMIMVQLLYVLKRASEKVDS